MSGSRSTRSLVWGAAMLLSGAAGASAQGPAEGSAMRAIAVAEGDTVRLVSRSAREHAPMARRAVRRLDYLITTAVPATDSSARHAQADRAARALGPEAEDLGYRVLSIGVCDTRACEQGKSPPSSWFLYERGASGWRRTTIR